GDYPAGQVRGPIQLTFAQSISPIIPLDISITRVAVTEIDEKKKTTTTMGRKSFVPVSVIATTCPRTESQCQGLLRSTMSRPTLGRFCMFSSFCLPLSVLTRR